jgi:hypothetical protein
MFQQLNLQLLLIQPLSLTVMASKLQLLKTKLMTLQCLQVKKTWSLDANLLKKK